MQINFCTNFFNNQPKNNMSETKNEEVWEPASADTKPDDIVRTVREYSFTRHKETVPHYTVKTGQTGKIDGVYKNSAFFVPDNPIEKNNRDPALEELQMPLSYFEVLQTNLNNARGEANNNS